MPGVGVQQLVPASASELSITRAHLGLLSRATPTLPPVTSAQPNPFGTGGDFFLFYFAPPPSPPPPPRSRPRTSMVFSIPAARSGSIIFQYATAFRAAPDC